MNFTGTKPATPNTHGHLRKSDFLGARLQRETGREIGPWQIKASFRDGPSPTSLPETLSRPYEGREHKNSLINLVSWADWSSLRVGSDCRDQRGDGWNWSAMIIFKVSADKWQLNSWFGIGRPQCHPDALTISCCTNPSLIPSIRVRVIACKASNAREEPSVICTRVRDWIDILLLQKENPDPN